MAKQKRTNIPMSGKIGNLIFSDGKNGHTVKMAPKPGSTNQAGLTGNSGRSGLINNIASQVNTVLDHYNGRFKYSGLYHRMLKLFRAEPENNRFLLLLQLKGQEINPSYQLEKLFLYEFAVKQEAEKLDVIITSKVHPQEWKYNSDCYDYELLLLSWDKTEAPPVVDRKLGPWIPMNGGLPEITFTFSKRPGMTSWVLILRVRLGVKEQYVEAFVAEGMRIIEAGSFDEEEMAVMKQKKEEKLAKSVSRMKKVEVKEERVGVVKIVGEGSHRL